MSTWRRHVCFSPRVLRSLLGALVISLGSSAATGASASTLDRAGALSMATRGADAAAATGARATLDNPAALASGGEPSALVGLDGRLYRVSFTQERGADRYPAVALRPVAAVTAALSLPLSERVGVGLLAHMPVSGPAQLQSYDHRRPQLPIWQSLGEGLNLVASVGWRPHPRFAVGGGVQVTADLSAQGDFELDLGAGDATRRRMDVRLTSRLVPFAALTADAGAFGRWMLRWRAPYKVDFDVPLQVELRGALAAQFTFSGQGLFSPETWTCAWAGDYGPWSAYASVRFERWSALQSFAPAVVTSLGATSAPPGTNAVDVWVPQLGGRVALHPKLALLAGVGFRPTPLPKADGDASWLDSHALEGSLGVSWRILPRGWIDVAVGWSHLVTRRVSRRSPDHPVGDVGLSGGVGHAAVMFRHSLRSL